MENKKTFKCIYCFKEKDIKEQGKILNFGDRACKICSKLFGKYVIMNKVV